MSKIFDCQRKEWVKRTPEEVVRQTLLQAMIQHLGYPSSLIAVEKELHQMPHLALSHQELPNRRADIVCFAKNIHPSHALYPLLLIECKQARIDQKAIEQVLGYNAFVQAHFVALAAAGEIQFLLPNGKSLSGLPRYEDLLKALQ